ncbi:MAG: flagellar basal body rod protein FlgB [Terriglobia bacterium]
MDTPFFEDGGMVRMERFMDLAVRRQKLIASNLSNVDTPGYKTVDIDFEQELQSQMAGSAGQGISMAVTDTRHLSTSTGAQGGLPAQAREVEGLTLRNDLNNVNIDREMSELSTNAMKFSAVSQMIAGKFRTLKAAITEGR